MRLTHTAARTLMLAAHDLARPRTTKATKADVLEAIRRMGVLQIDTINVVARSPYLVLWSRLGDYDMRWLDELLAEGALFEYWAHEACFVPIEDYALFRPRMFRASLFGIRDINAWMEERRAEIESLLARIRERGPVRSADFERSGERADPWEWHGRKPERHLLQVLLTAGRLHVVGRRNFHRIYDLHERAMPGWDDSRLPTAEEIRRALVLKSVHAVGVIGERRVADYYRIGQSEARATLQDLVGEGAITQVSVDGWDEPAYIHPDRSELARAAVEGAIQPTLTTLLSPFDPLVWDRTRALRVFGFDYRIECYTPEPKRRYGYFTLPILRRGRLIGRLDAKAHRRERRFEVKSLHLEPNVRISNALFTDLADALRRCARWHGTPEVIVGRADPPESAGLLQRAIDG